MASVRSRLHGALVVGLVPMAVISLVVPAAAQVPASASSSDRWQPFIAEASRRFGIPEAWICAVMRAESGGQAMLDGRPITSHAGAVGLMQLMPATWVELRERYGLGTDPNDPRDKILAGTAYLRELYARYGYPNLFAAYNAGPARVDDTLSSGRALPIKTRTYLALLGQSGFESSRTSATSTGTRLFFTRHGVAAGSTAPLGAPSSGSLFMPLNRARRGVTP